MLEKNKLHMMKPCLIGANYVDLKSMASSITFLFEMFETFPTWSPHPVGVTGGSYASAASCRKRKGKRQRTQNTP